jgi:hypothetical protein
MRYCEHAGKRRPNQPRRGQDPVEWAAAGQRAANAGFTGDPVARCHVVGGQLNGPGSADNLVPCFQRGVNTGRHGMRNFEDEAVAAARANMAVEYRVIPVYKDKNSTTPLGPAMYAVGQYSDGRSATSIINIF